MSAEAEQKGGGIELRESLRDWVSRPLFDYHLLLAVTALLTGIGLVMVLSSTMASSGAAGNVWAEFSRQAAMVAAGLLVFWLVLKVKVSTIRAAALPLLGLALVLLVLVLIPGIGIGLEETGAQSWILVGGVTMQPSEFAKIALALWGSKFLADRIRVAVTTKQLFGAFIFVAMLVLGLVFFQRDLGMVASMGFVVLALAWFAGLPRFLVAVVGAVGLMVVIAASMAVGFRSARMQVFCDTLLGRFNETQGPGYQSYQGILSLADGSMTGVGLGQSRAKWFYLPEAKNDFIFAIIGEELGFLGAGIVVLLYALLGWVGLRIAAAQKNLFLRLLAGTLTLATVLQAFINIGYVVGVLPVTGLQLPLISAGGTSAIVTLFSMGLLATCARHEPEAVSAMQTSGRPAIDRWFGIPEPLPYDPATENGRRSRSHREPQRFGPPVTGADDVVREPSRARAVDRRDLRDGRDRDARDLRGTRGARDTRDTRDDRRDRREPADRGRSRGVRPVGGHRGERPAAGERYRDSERGDRRPRGRGSRRPGGPDRRYR